MTAVKSRSLGATIWAVLAIPLGVIMITGGMLIVENWRIWSDASRVSRQMVVVAALSNLVHEQQRERGATSLFLNSRGAQFGPELAAQRDKTDERSAQLRTVLDTTAQRDISDKVGTVLAQMQQDLSRRPALRIQVDAQTISPKDAVEYYTGLNAQALSIIGNIGAQSAQAEIASAVSGFSSFLAAKERAGIERAVGSGGFAVGGFDVARLMVLDKLIAQQELGFTFFRRYADDEQLGWLAQIDNAEATKTLQTMRDVALAFPQTGSLEGVTGPEFFAAASERITQMKQMENRLADHIIARANAIRAGARNLVLLAAFVSVAGLFVTLILGRRAIQRVSHDVRGVIMAADKMSGGQLDVVIPNSSLQEMLDVSTALEHFRASILVAQEQEAKAAADKMRRMQEDADRKQALRDERAAQQARVTEEERKARQAELAVIGEINRVVASCARGDFTHRINMAGKIGVFADICQGMNQISDTTDQALSAVQRGLQHLADGDLTYRLSDEFDGIFAEMCHAANRASEALARAVNGINQSAQMIENSTGEIGDAAGDLARRSEQNAAMLEQTASALEQMSGSVASVSNSSGEARVTVKDITQCAEHGHQVVQDAITAMEAIQASSERIERVLQVIDDIAFQTNLLALNAGVEAARAGEAGRGFAVVASEVRALAQRSSEASREISEMITTSGENVGRGVGMVNASGTALSEIVSGIRKVFERIEQIANAAKETEVGISEIAKATNELDRSTQQNAAMFEETNAAIATLRSETSSLVAEVAIFQIDSAQASRAKVA
ncbi:hypothetical protein BFP70_04735 [Thioclava sp. SK-1]|uniref:methyl-accepting chemotaxis protein n=1 Tax=Thioclava sp. SK-1 TaxID=1889770 RepID=UPI000824BBF6|nr:nitrate- and nitrite sensing domain-containing protein [Thioclava sp. SK-1]OCX66532.1 hypothetical protein BFP70_04735 [Thioclava sp. SK-1]